MSSELKTNKISPATGTALQIGDSGDTITIPSGATLTNSGSATGFGKVLQVVSFNKTDIASTTSETFVTTGVEVSITPSSSSNKILVMAQVGSSGNGGVAATGIILQRDSTVLNQGDAASNRSRYTGGYGYVYNMYDIKVFPIIYLDSPSSTSSLTYKIMYKTTASSQPAYLNKSEQDVDNVHYGRGSSSITVLEIAG